MYILSWLIRSWSSVTSAPLSPRRRVGPAATFAPPPPVEAADPGAVAVWLGRADVADAVADEDGVADVSDADADGDGLALAEADGDDDAVAVEDALADGTAEAVSDRTSGAVVRTPFGWASSREGGSEESSPLTTPAAATTVTTTPVTARTPVRRRRLGRPVAETSWPGFEPREPPWERRTSVARTSEGSTFSCMVASVGIAADGVVTSGGSGADRGAASAGTRAGRMVASAGIAASCMVEAVASSPFAGGIGTPPTGGVPYTEPVGSTPPAGMSPWNRGSVPCTCMAWASPEPPMVPAPPTGMPPLSGAP
jgi:hypothetical protein